MLAHGPHIETEYVAGGLLPIVDEIIDHIERGRSFGVLTKLTKPAWHRVIDHTYVGSRRPSLKDATDFRAAHALLRTQLIREQLLERWEREIGSHGGPTKEELGDSRS